MASLDHYRERGFCPEGEGADRATLRLSAKGCEAAPKRAAPAVSGAPRRQALLPVPDSSRTNETSPGPLPHIVAVRGQAKRRPVRTYRGQAPLDPLPHNAFLPGGRGSGLVREGLRSGPKTGRFGCIWCIEVAGFAAGSRQFADKSAPTYSGSSRTNETSPGPPHKPCSGGFSVLVLNDLGSALGNGLGDHIHRGIDLLAVTLQLNLVQLLKLDLL